MEDVYEQLTPKLRAAASPSIEKGNKEKSDKQGLELHPYYKIRGKKHNNDFCDSCGECGKILCCDMCTASFHLQCHNPPLKETDIPMGPWYCHACKYTAALSDSDESSTSSANKLKDLKSSYENLTSKMELKIMIPDENTAENNSIKRGTIIIRNRKNVGTNDTTLTRLKRKKSTDTVKSDSSNSSDNQSVSSNVTKVSVGKINTEENFESNSVLMLKRKLSTQHTKKQSTKNGNELTKIKTKKVNKLTEPVLTNDDSLSKMDIKNSENPKKLNKTNPQNVEKLNKMVNTKFGTLKVMLENCDSYVKNLDRSQMRRKKTDKISNTVILDPEIRTLKEGFDIICNESRRMNSKVFELPTDIWNEDDIEFPGADKDQNYNDLDSNDLIRTPFRICFHCKRSCLHGQMISCDYCPAHFHLNCLDPPMCYVANAKWMCPLHPHHVLDDIMQEPDSFTERLRWWGTLSKITDYENIEEDFIMYCKRKQNKVSNPPISTSISVKVPDIVKYHYAHPPSQIPSIKDLMNTNDECIFRKKLLKISHDDIKKSNACCSCDSMHTLSEEESMFENKLLGFQSFEENDAETKLNSVVDDISKLINSDYSSVQERDLETDVLKFLTEQKILVEIKNTENVSKDSRIKIDSVEANIKSEPASNFGTSCTDVIMDDVEEGNTEPTLCLESFSAWNLKHEPSEHNIVDETFAKEIVEAIIKQNWASENVKLNESSSSNLPESGNSEPVETDIQNCEKNLENFYKADDRTDNRNINDTWKDIEELLLNDIDEVLLKRFGHEDVLNPDLKKSVITEKWKSLIQDIPPSFTTLNNPLIFSRSLFGNTDHDAYPAAKVKAVLCPLSHRAPMVYMYQNSLSIGYDLESDLCLQKYGDCNFVSEKHAVIFFDKVTQMYELINYSEYNTVVDNIKYTLNVSYKRHKRIRPPINASNKRKPIPQMIKNLKNKTRAKFLRSTYKKTDNKHISSTDEEKSDKISSSESDSEVEKISKNRTSYILNKTQTNLKTEQKLNNAKKAMFNINKLVSLSYSEMSENAENDLKAISQAISQNRKFSTTESKNKILLTDLRKSPGPCENFSTVSEEITQAKPLATKKRGRPKIQNRDRRLSFTEKRGKSKLQKTPKKGRPKLQNNEKRERPNSEKRGRPRITEKCGRPRLSEKRGRSKLQHTPNKKNLNVKKKNLGLKSVERKMTVRKKSDVAEKFVDNPNNNNRKGKVRNTRSSNKIKKKFGPFKTAEEWKSMNPPNIQKPATFANQVDLDFSSDDDFSNFEDDDYDSSLFYSSLQASATCKCRKDGLQIPYPRDSSWESSAILHHGSYISFGCVEFIFSIVDYPAPFETRYENDLHSMET